MNTKRLEILKLCCRGTGVTDAVITFQSGLNVITGPSNTGKSYIFKCIDFMLGGNTPPKVITESAGYEQVLMEFKLDNNSFTLVRSITGGAAQLYNCGIDEWTPSQFVVSVLSERSGTTGKSISEFLLQKMSFPRSIKLKFDRFNATKPLSLRLISHLFCINETKIQSESSPILQGVVNDETVLESAFRYLITGQDDKGLISVPKPQITNTRIQAKEEVYSSLLEIAYAELIAIGVQLKNVDASEIEPKIVEATKALNSYAAELENLSKIKASTLSELSEIESKIIAQKELSSRFSLLKEHYKSDIKRLELLIEGAFLVDQLQVTRCSTCGQELTSEADEHENFDGFDPTIVEASEAETRKIHVLLSDLESTMFNLAEELSKMNKEQEQIKASLRKTDELIDSALLPKVNLEKTKLSELIELKDLFTRKNIAQRKIDDLRISLAQVKSVEREQVTLLTDSLQHSNTTFSTYPEGLVQLCSIMENLLRHWEYSEPKRVDFDKTVNDFNIGGIPRQSNGKGTRAFLHAAFNLALLIYCQSKDRGFPNFIVLDSPLTTLREGENIPGEEVAPSMQESFFNYLAELTDVQTIVLENKEPPLAASKKCNLIKFTRNNLGRYGFFPNK